MDIFVIPLVAFVASVLTFFSGFGLGTLLMPVFGLFFPIKLSIALTAIVHLFNNLLKLRLVGKYADRRTILEFGIPAIFSAVVGAWLLGELSDIPSTVSYSFLNNEFHIHWVNLIISILIIGFTLFELMPGLRSIEFNSKFLLLGGILSGFLGGLSGHQGALRSAFLTRMGLSKESFIGTGVVFACFVDLARMGIYAGQDSIEKVSNHLGLISTSIFAAFIGSYIGYKFLNKVTIIGIQRIVASMLILFALALGMGIV